LLADRGFKTDDAAADEKDGGKDDTKDAVEEKEDK
jgi:hypothetical protein